MLQLVRKILKRQINVERCCVLFNEAARVAPIVFRLGLDEANGHVHLPRRRRVKPRTHSLAMIAGQFAPRGGRWSKLTLTQAGLDARPRGTKNIWRVSVMRLGCFHGKERRSRRQSPRRPRMDASQGQKARAGRRSHRCIGENASQSKKEGRQKENGQEEGQQEEHKQEEDWKAVQALIETRPACAKRLRAQAAVVKSASVQHKRLNDGDVLMTSPRLCTGLSTAIGDESHRNQACGN